MKNRFLNEHTSRMVNSIVVCLHLLFTTTVLYGNSLSYVVRSEDAAGTEHLLKSGSNPNELDDAGYSPLFHSVVTRNIQFVEMLLKAGATASIKGQVKEPLWAAVVNGDLDIITLLIKHGADPEAGESPLRPIDAAIFSGRVEVLRKLIESKPGISLPYELRPDKANFNMVSDMVEPGVMNFVDDAIIQKHYSMAEFLVRQGSLKNLNKNKLNDLLLQAMSIEPVQRDLIYLLLQAGADPLEEADTRWKFSADYLAPQSGLEVSALMGRADIIKRFATRNIGHIPANRLLTLALSSGDEATVTAVRSFVPNAQPYAPERRPTQSKYLLGPEASPRHTWETRATAEILLKPRLTVSPSVAKTPNAKTRVAVIADADSNSEAFLLAAKLSLAENIMVLDRDEVAAVLRERDFSFETKAGMNEVADLLNAQELVMIEKPGTKNDGVLRTEVVDVYTGLITHRMHTNAAKLNPELWVASIHSAILRSKERIKSADGLHAVTLLGVGTIKGAKGGDAIRSLVSAALMSEVDNTPGCVALTRLQMRPLIEEQVLGGKGSLWKAGWAIEAGASALTAKRVELHLRLRDLSSSEAFEAKIQGEIGQVDMLVAQAWTELITKSRIGKIGARVAKSAKGENVVLLEEAKWRFKLGEYEAAAQLADALCVMNAADAEAQLLRISARIRSLMPPLNEVRFENSTWVGDTVLYDIEGWLEVLALMQENFENVFETDLRRNEMLRGQGGTRLDDGCKDWLSTMIRLRAVTPAWAIRPDDKDALAEFDRELENWCRRFFNKCAEDHTKSDLVLHSGDLVRLLETHGLHNIPWLSSIALELLAKRFRMSQGNEWDQSIQLGFVFQAIKCLSRQTSELLLNHLHDQDESRKVALLQDIEFIIAADSSRVKLAEKIASRILQDLRAGRNVTVNLLPISQLARYRVIERKEFNPLPLTPDDLLSPVPARGVSDEELLRNLGHYGALRSSNKKLVADNLLRSAMIANRNEIAPGTSRIRSRLSAAMRCIGEDDPRLTTFLNSLPPDFLQDKATTTDNNPTAMRHITLKEMPAGAKFFMVTQVLPDRHRGVIWWAGGFLRNKVNCALSNDEIIPGLVRVNPVTGETAYAITSNQWLQAESNDNKWINPNSMSVLANEEVVIWYVAKSGVYHVDSPTMKLENIRENIGLYPLSIQGGMCTAALIGDTVFVAEQIKSDYNEFKGRHEINFQRVLRLRRGEAPVVVVQTGRRPKVSELDTEYTELTMVTSHEGKLRIIANSEPAFLRLGIKMVDFEPNGSLVKDSLVTDQHKIERNFMKAVMEKQTVLAYRKSWPLKNGGKLFAGTKSGMLELEKNGIKTSVPVKLPVPKGLDVTFWADRFDVNGQKTNERGDFTISDFATSHCAPVIVYQNEDTLGVMISWRGSISGLFPVIWQVKESSIKPLSDK